MEKQMSKLPQMMDFIWLLNAADNNSIEVKELLLSFLRQQQDFKELRLSFPANTPQGEFLEQEIRKNLKSLEELAAIVQEIICVLKAPGAGADNE